MLEVNERFVTVVPRGVDLDNGSVIPKPVVETVGSLIGKNDYTWVSVFDKDDETCDELDNVLAEDLPSWIMLYTVDNYDVHAGTNSVHIKLKGILSWI